MIFGKRFRSACGALFILAGLGAAGLGAAPAQARILGIFLADQNNGQGQVPFETDGTAAGTIKIPLPARSNPAYAFWPLDASIAITSVAGNSYNIDFLSRSGAVTTWNGCPGCILQYFVQSGSNLYFQATDASGNNSLYRTTGTVAGTQLVCGISKSCGVVDIGVILYTVFTFQQADYVVLGAPSSGKTWVYKIGPSLLSLAYTYQNPQGSNPQNWDVPVGNQIVFSNTTASQGSELWATDGTQAGRHIVKSFFPGQSSGMPLNPAYPLRVLTAGGKALVIATDPSVGTSLWSTDGTTAGTTRLQIGKDDAYRIYQNYGTWAQIVGSKLYYLSGNPGSRLSGFGKSLYVLDTATGGAPQVVKWMYQGNDMMIMPSADLALTSSGYLYTTAMQVGTATCRIEGSDFVGGGCDDKLYRLNLASGTVQLVANPNAKYDAACESTCDSIMHLTASGNTILFSASDRNYHPPGTSGRPVTNAQPWVSKGAPATTFKLKDLAPYVVGGSMPYQFAAMP